MIEWLKRLIRKQEEKHLNPNDTISREIREAQAEMRRQMDDPKTDRHLNDAIASAKALEQRTLMWADTGT